MKRTVNRGREVRIGNRRIVAKGLAIPGASDYYHWAMRVSWVRFVLATAVVFTAFNAVFAGLYAMFPESIANVPPDRPWHVIFFSIETLATVGYGDMHPQSEWGHWVASLETFAGVTLSAVLTGLIFARFSRPTARLLFADKIVIGQFEGMPHLMIRVANARVNMISDAIAKVWLLATVESAEGKRFRRFHDLKLERVENPSFVLSWTLFHKIDADSPLFGWDLARLEAGEVALTVTVRGTDESVSQELRARHTYGWQQIVFDHQFVDLLENDEEGRVVLNYGRFHDVEPEES